MNDSVNDLGAAAATVPDNRDVVAEALRKALNCLPRYSFHLDDDGVVRRVPYRCGDWIEWQAVHELFDSVKVDSLLATTPTLPGMPPMPPFTPAQRAAACVAACDGLPDHALYGGWTAGGLSKYAKSLEDELGVRRTAQGVEQVPADKEKLHLALALFALAAHSDMLPVGSVTLAEEVYEHLAGDLGSFDNLLGLAETTIRAALLSRAEATRVRDANPS